MVSEPPKPPEPLPKYIGEGLPKQDKNTLQRTQEYITALIEYRENLSREEIQPDDGEEIEEIEDSGSTTTVIKRVDCGKDNCSKCPDTKHGPYRYEISRKDGSLVWEYIGPVNK